MKRLAKILAIFIVVLWFAKPPAASAATFPSACSNPGSNQNKAGIMIDTHHDDFDQAAQLVGKGGWVVELAFPDTGLILQEHLEKHPEVNMVIWGMPGEGSKVDADAWCATLGKLNTNGKKVYFKPWNTANSTSAEDTYAVKGTPKEVAEYQNNLNSCLSKSGLLNNKVVLLSPVLITSSDVTAPYTEYFANIKDPSQKKNVARSLYDVWSGDGEVCSNPNSKDNACKTKEFAKSVGGEFTYAVEGGVANPDINYRDAEMATFIRKMADPKFPGSWVSDDKFIMGAMYANDPDTYGENWRIWRHGPKTRKAYEALRKNGCVPDIQNASQVSSKFNTWFETVRTSLIACDVFGYSSAKELCNAPPKPETSKVLTFPPLGSLQVCPKEIPVDSKFSEETAAGGVGRCEVPLVPEPEICQNPPTEETDARSDYCKGTDEIPGGIAGWCYPETCGQHSDAQQCDRGRDIRPDGCGKFIKAYCLGEGGDDDSYRTYQKISACTADKTTIGRCNAYDVFRGVNKTAPPVPGTKIYLPACVPTYNEKARCVTECGEPIKMEENLQIGQITTTFGQCLASAECRAKINIQNKDGGNAFFLPFAAKLADYFTGILDAEHQSAESLDNLQNALRDKTTSREAAQTMLNQAGVVRKLLPGEIQDRLKCDFIEYVKQRKANGQNTKYVERVDGKLTGKEFKVFDKNITEIVCKPLVSTFGTESSAYQADLEGWYSAGIDRYWYAVPLFSDDDSQGEIQFVSPTIFSSAFQPVNVTIPVVQRLAAVTKIIQQALIPAEAIAVRNSLVENPNPLVRQFALPTYGKEIDPNLFLPNGSQALACTRQEWKNFYAQSGDISYDKTKNFRLDGQNLTTALLADLGEGSSGMNEYNRAVECNIPPLTEASDSKMCSIAPNGEITCAVQGKPGSGLTAGSHSGSETVQVRSSFPHLFDIAEQTIGATTGLLRIFQPNAEKEGKADEFEEAFNPVPASTDGVFYQLSATNGRLAIDDSGKDEGWKLYFYKLGGLWNARNFVVDLLIPEPGDTEAGAK